MAESDITFSAVDQDSAIVRFLNKHKAGKRGMFVVYMDRTTVKHKWKIFGFLLAVNTTIAALIVWRLIAGKGKYLPLLLPGNMGLMDRAGVKPSSSLSEFGWTTLNIGFDSILAILGSTLLLPFVTGPLWTRLRYGIRPAEPVFRSPIQESQLATLAKLPADERERRWNKEMLRCVDRRYLATCPADFMSLELWAVDYAVARDANALIAKRELIEEELELSIWLLDTEQRWTVYWVPK